MTTPDPALLELFATVRNGILITLKRNGRPQSSVVSHRFEADGPTLRVSLTADRAKTRNLRRDPRATYHVSRPDMRGYAVGEAVAELSPVAADPHDDTVEALVAYYRAVSGAPGLGRVPRRHDRRPQAAAHPAARPRLRLDRRSPGQPLSRTIGAGAHRAA